MAWAWPMRFGGTTAAWRARCDHVLPSAPHPFREEPPVLSSHVLGLVIRPIWGWAGALTLFAIDHRRRPPPWQHNVPRQATGIDQVSSERLGSLGPSSDWWMIQVVHIACKARSAVAQAQVTGNGATSGPVAWSRKAQARPHAPGRSEKPASPLATCVNRQK